MKKLFLIFFYIFLINTSFANEIKIPKFKTSVVFYCIDDLITGMQDDYKSTKVYESQRFNIKFDTENLSRIIVDGKEFEQTGDEWLRIYVDNTGSIIRFYEEGDKMGYHRSRIFGMSDSIYVANGKCEKF